MKSKVYNNQIILDALNKYTNETFSYDDDIGYMSDNFEVAEVDFYLFEVTRVVRQLDTGIVDHFLLCSSETLADAIDFINSD